MVPARIPDPVEQSGFGGGHPHLAAPLETREEGGAALRIKVSGHLVEKEDRRLSAPVRNEVRVREHQTEKKRFLFPGGRARRLHPLGPMHDEQVLAVRTNGRSPCRGVPPPAVAKPDGQIGLVPTLDRDGGPGEFVFRSGLQAMLQLGDSA